MALADFKELSQAIQSLAVAAAVLIGGVWALYRFFSLRSIELARAELDKARRVLEERGMVDIAMDPEQMHSDLGYSIAVRVSLKNVGSGPEVINWSTSHLLAVKVKSIADGVFRFSTDPILGQRPQKLTDSLLAPGECTTHAFLIPVPTPGIYYLVFDALCSRKAITVGRGRREAAEVSQPEELAWTAALFFQVQGVA